MLNRLFLLLSLIINSIGSLNAGELNTMAHKQCESREGTDYKDCYTYFSRIYPERDTNNATSLDANQPLILKLLIYGEPSAYITDQDFLKLHFDSMHAYWLERTKGR